MLWIIEEKKTDEDLNSCEAWRQISYSLRCENRSPLTMVDVIHLRNAMLYIHI